jgi:hypothetical protein
MPASALWRFYVAFIGPDEYHILDEEPSATGLDGLLQLNITGPTRPETPAVPLTYADLLRWQVSLIEAGYLLGPLASFSPKPKPH